MIKIAMLANSMSINGISSVIMNYCNNLNLNYYNISIIAGAPIDDVYRIECEELGIKIIELPIRKIDTLRYYTTLYKTFKNEKYDIVHIHCNSATITIELFLAMICGIKIRIAHSHNTTCENIKIHKVLLPLFNKLYTDGFACGRQAGEWLFKNKSFYIMKNGFDTSKFEYKISYRNEIRHELGIHNEYLIGHIGRFNYQKNQEYLIKIFENICKYRDDAILILVGSGPDYERVAELVEKSKYANKIILYGETKEPYKIYSALDIFVFPSRFEGLPVTLLEAQISGLPCLISDKITSECVFSNKVELLNIEIKLEIWSEKIIEINKEDRENFYQNNIKEIMQYDIKKCVKSLEKKYDSLIKQD